MLTIEYTPDAQPISDFDVEQWVVTAIASAHSQINSHFKCCNSMLIRAVLCHIAEGYLPHSDIQFMFNQQVIKPNQYGALGPNWPRGFADMEVDYSERTLKAAVKTKRKVSP